MINELQKFKLLDFHLRQNGNTFNIFFLANYLQLIILHPFFHVWFHGYSETLVKKK